MKHNEETWWTIKFLKYYEDENSKYSLSSGVLKIHSSTRAVQSLEVVVLSEATLS